MAEREPVALTKTEGLKSSIFICLRALLLALLWGADLGGCRQGPQPAVLTLSIAASLQDAMVEVEAAYKKDHTNLDFRNNFGSSGTLAREIEQGAPVDALFSAGAKQMDQLQRQGLLVPGTRRDLLRNSLVLVAPLDSRLHGFDDLVSTSVRLVAVGDPASVPAGQFGQQALKALHVYDPIKGKLVLGKDVRQVLTYVETGNADAGLVYATDARISSRVRVVAVAPESSHDPILYPVSVIQSSRSLEAARAFLNYLSSSAARAIFIRYGFTMA